MSNWQDDLLYDVVHFDQSAFRIISDKEAARLRAGGDPGDPGYDPGPGTKIASAISAKAAAELVGLRGVPQGVEGFTDHLAWLESHVAEFGSLAIGNLHEDFEVRRTRE